MFVHIFNSRPLVNVITSLAVAVVVSIIYILSLNEKYYNIARLAFLFLFTFVYVPLSYFTTPGTYSAMPYLLILVVFILSIISSHKYEYLFPLAVIVESIILFRMELRYPDVFNTYTDDAYRIMDLSINFAVVTIAIVLTIILIMRRFRLYNDELYEVSVRDALTGLYNKGYFEDFIDLEYNRSTRSGYIFSMVFIDIDNFKSINDKYGHRKGDEVLKGISKIISENMRSYDVTCRYGGDEFIIVFPNTSLEDARKYIDRMEASFKAFLSPYSDLKVAVSYGMSDSSEKSLEEIIEFADSQLYNKKRDKKIK